MRHLLPLLIVTVLAGCTASAKYDFDLTCRKGVVMYNGEAMKSTSGETVPYLNIRSFAEDNITLLTCFTPEDFQIQCEDNSLQSIGDERFCETPEGKSVRVRLVSELTNDQADEIMNNL